jgi:hypothetical protein
MAISSCLSMASILFSRTHFSLSEAVYFLSREPHSMRRRRSFSRPLLSRWSTSYTWCTGKRVMSTTSGTETCPGAPSLGCPMTTSGSSSAALSSSPGAEEDAPTAGPVVTAGPPTATSPIDEEATTLAAVVVFASGTASVIGIPSLLVAMTAESWVYDPSEPPGLC